MSYGGPKPWHTVTVTSNYDAENEMWDPPRIEFKCTALYGSCRFYPDCECESWGDDHYGDNGVGHERIHQDECWLQGWFDNPESTEYVGPDAEDYFDIGSGIPRGMNRTGRITACGNGYDGYIEWEFVATEGNEETAS